MGMNRRNKWLIGIGVSVLALAIGVLIAARILARRFEPYIREQAVEYLRRRFDSQVELTALRVRVPTASPLCLLLTQGRGALARVEGEGLLLRHRHRQDVPPLLRIKEFAFDVDLGTLFDVSKRVPLVTLDGMEIHIPPKGERPKLGGSRGGVLRLGRMLRNPRC